MKKREHDAIHGGLHNAHEGVAYAIANDEAEEEREERLRGKPQLRRLVCANSIDDGKGAQTDEDFPEKHNGWCDHVDGRDS